MECTVCKLNIFGLGLISETKESLFNFLFEHKVIKNHKMQSKREPIEADLDNEDFRYRRYGADVIQKRRRKVSRCSFYQSIFKGAGFEQCRVPIKTSERLTGGPRSVVEIDEAKIGKRNNKRGRWLEGYWIFGGFDRSTRKVFVVQREENIKYDSHGLQKNEEFSLGGTTYRYVSLATIKDNFMKYFKPNYGVIALYICQEKQREFENISMWLVFAVACGQDTSDIVREISSVEFDYGYSNSF
ncbi:hypothetical protein RF11_14045 [Thelohanellus kitauei]|uniref:Uncharacterized protein n=1 Tax=Thelohanellus kitauei TaxID=669202 RepID=A0A0C2J7B4_THEKT|nr:hypothetical protein RF11_14045 [Thelohanellus kitauei]